MSDYNQISEEDHEMNYILREFGKRQTEINRELLRKCLRNFKLTKGGPRTKNYIREEFYNYLRRTVLHKLE